MLTGFCTTTRSRRFPPPAATPIVALLTLATALRPGAGRADPWSRTPQQKTVEQFYVLLSSGAYRRAYALFDAPFQAANPYASWVAGYVATLQIDWRTRTTADPDTVVVQLRAEDTAQPDDPVRYYGGTWQLVRGSRPGTWLLHAASIGSDGPWADPDAPDFSAFAGPWNRDGNGTLLLVRADGTATFSYRTGPCAENPELPCDPSNGVTTLHGGHETITLTSIDGNTAWGTYDDGAPATLTLLPAGAVSLLDSSGTRQTLCGLHPTPRVARQNNC